MKMSARLRTVAAFALVTFNPVPAAAEQWTCTIDLQQGHTGTMDFSRMGGKFAGTLTAGPSETHRIRGVWNGETIQFERRLVPATSVQPFVGVAKKIETGEVRMGGRFAAGLAGVWSADCRLSGVSDPTPPPDVKPPTEPPPTPQPPTPQPPTERPPATGSCSIAGSATGPRANLAGQWNLMLFGPNNDRAHKATVRFQNGSYRFTSLPDGEYLLRTDTKGDFGFSPVPSSHRVQCTGGAVTGQNFDFR